MFRIMQITCGFRFELLPDKDQRSLMSRTAGCCRLVFNKALALQNELKDQQKKLLTYNELSRELTAWKKESETAFLREVPSQPLQQTLMDLSRGLSDYFRKKVIRQKKAGLISKVKILEIAFDYLKSNPSILMRETPELNYRNWVGFDIEKAVTFVFVTVTVHGLKDL